MPDIRETDVIAIIQELQAHPSPERVELLAAALIQIGADAAAYRAETRAAIADLEVRRRAANGNRH